jgi:glycosyltransferase involved in cell wall biosynthesis
MQKISILIPVYDNERSLQQLYTSVVAVFEGKNNWDYELIFVNDGSSDGSKHTIKQIQETDEKVRYIGFTRNFGQIAAICAGLESCKGEACIIRSADLQDSVSLISEFIKGWEAGSKVVIGYRDKRSDNFSDRILSGFFYSLIASFNPAMPKGGFDYCLLDRSVVNGMNRFKYRNRFLQADILSLGHAALLIPYERTKDDTAKFRESTSLSFKIKYALDGIFNATHLPTRTMMILGFLSFLAGFITAFLYPSTVNDSSTWIILFTILVTSGMLMMMAGILGEYLWRIHDEIRERPQYIIEDED